VSNRGIGRARMFMGGLLLFAAVIAWFTFLMMSPHGQTVARGTEHVRTVIVDYVTKGAVGTLILCALAGWLLFPRRRPRWPARDWALGALIGLLVVSSIYELVWLQTSVVH
jgi:hypothetical protein